MILSVAPDQKRPQVMIASATRCRVRNYNIRAFPNSFGIIGHEHDANRSLCLESRFYGGIAIHRWRECRWDRKQYFPPFCSHFRKTVKWQWMRTADNGYRLNLINEHFPSKGHRSPVNVTAAAAFNIPISTSWNNSNGTFEHSPS